jgi:molybdopterin converting factor small subunit
MTPENRRAAEPSRGHAEAIEVAVTVRLPRSLRTLFAGCPAEVAVRAGTVFAAIEALDVVVPGIRPRLLDAGPSIREHLNLFVDGDLAALDTPLRAGSVLLVVPAVSGG